MEVVLLVLLAVACGGASVRHEGGGAGEGADPPTGGSPERGGTSSGATGGVATGGVATGGVATGGVATGGNGASGGTAGSATGGLAGNSTGGVVIEGDPYPRVEFENGNGYVDTCQRFPGSHGFSCWHFDGDESSLCEDPATCNACLCYVPCDRASAGVSECPAGFTGTARPSCLHETPNTIGACMLVCDASTTCPDGMACVPNPTLSVDVCMWIASAGR